jgi:hypothetical protein
MAAKKSTDGRNDNRPNGKAWKKNPGSDGVKVKHNVTRAGRIEGRSAANHAKREEWKAKGGHSKHTSIPHWKTGEVYKAPKNSQPVEELV